MRRGSGPHGGISSALAARLEAHPRQAREILQVAKTVASDLIDTQGEFQAGTGSGFHTYVGGGLRLAGNGVDVLAENTVRASGQDITSLVPPLSSALEVGVVEWGGADPESIEIHTATAYLNPDTGAGQEVDVWGMQLFRVQRISAWSGGDGEVWDLAPICQPAFANAGGAAGDVTFAVANGQTPVTVGPAPFVLRGANPYRPMTLMVVWALKDDSTPAANAAWEADSGNSTISDGAHDVARYSLSLLSDGSESSQGTRYVSEGPALGIPAFALQGNLYTDSTRTWSGADDLDLGAAPGSDTILEVVSEFAEPSDTSVTIEIDDGTAGWTEVLDGDRIGEDRTAVGGSDLSGLARQQTYSIRATLTTSADTLKTPRVFRIGIREVELTEVDGLFDLGEAAWAVDPVWCQSEIPTLKATLHRDGVRDYRSWAEELFSGFHLNEFALRFFVGHPDLHRKDWLHVDDFIVERYDPGGTGIAVDCVSPLKYTLATLPPKVTADRSPISYASQTLKAVEEDLLTGQIGVAARYLGPGIEDDTTTVTRTISEKVAGLDVLQQLNFLNGSAKLSSQGRLKSRAMFDDEPFDPSAYFPMEEIEILGIDVGYDKRIVEFDVPYGWSEDSGEYAAERESTASAAAISNLGHAIGGTQVLPDEFAKWIADSGLADTIGERMVKFFGPGLGRIRFRSRVPRPQLEPGDPCVIEQDRFVGRDPNLDQGIRGRAWVGGRIVMCHDVMGTEFTAWVRSWVNILPGVTATDRDLRIERTLVIPASALGGSAGELHPSTSGVTEEYEAPVQGIPVGAEIIEFTSVMARATSADIAQSRLVNPTYISPYGWTEIAGWDNTHSVDAVDYTTETDPTSIDVTEGKPLTVRVQLRGDASSDDAALAYLRIKYRLGVAA